MLANENYIIKDSSEKLGHTKQAEVTQEAC